MNNLILSERDLVIRAASENIGDYLTGLDPNKTFLIVSVFVIGLGNFDVEYDRITTEGKHIWMPKKVVNRNYG